MNNQEEIERLDAFIKYIIDNRKMFHDDPTIYGTQSFLLNYLKISYGNMNLTSANLINYILEHKNTLGLFGIKITRHTSMDNRYYLSYCSEHLAYLEIYKST